MHFPTFIFPAAKSKCFTSAEYRAFQGFSGKPDRVCGLVLFSFLYSGKGYLKMCVGVFR
ncbi:hypothetical protein EIKCOROL_02440 [Eikenella corrodens ATCC 23834]|uniref:Uncharacterized protein n=1 Tax=Eikenella corrodens ATCC 23834 TaxID=546274 RepID=C0DYH6_EIKCO|nr:hypothetical protein EIKCOROL_02440 [Eikenella corrodens ATCC 23834]